MMRRPYSYSYSIVPDVDAAIAPGSDLRIQALTFRPDTACGLREVRNIGHYRGGIGYLSFFRDNWLTIEGSATLVAPGIALTAFHVIEDLIEHIASGELQMRLFCPAQRDGVVWNVREVRRVGLLDLALLSLTPSTHLSSRRQIALMTICAVPPHVGQTVMISGFRAGTDVVPVTDGLYFPIGEGNALHGIRLFRSVGRVIEQDGPNSDILVQVDATTEGGMSGGAAFNERGECFGVLSSSITFGDGTGVSRVQALWPSFGTSIPSQIFTGEAPIYEYPGVQVVGFDRIKIEHPWPHIARVTLLSAAELRD